MSPSRVLSVLALLAMPLAAAAQTPGDSPVERGEYLLRAGGCVACHTAAGGGEFLAGGRALLSPVGTFHAPNITPDPEHGIGGWSLDDFVTAMREGSAPDGTHYYPAFPYPAFTLMTDADLADLKAYLDTVPPVAKANLPHALDFPYSLRFGMALWNMLFLEEGPFRPDPEKDEMWNRGAYLVEALAHCGQCHTPRGFTQVPDEKRAFSGNPTGAEGKVVPNITPDPETGIGGWSERDLAYYLQTGIDPDGDVAGDAMAEVIEDGTSHLSDEDRTAMARYILSRPAVRTAPSSP